MHRRSLRFQLGAATGKGQVGPSQRWLWYIPAVEDCRHGQREGVRLMEKTITRGTACAILLAGMALAGHGACQVASAQAQSPAAESAAGVETGVRDFMRHVAHDVTREGPSAWRKYFADSPSF